MQKQYEPELIARSLDGDHEAYSQLVDRYKNAIYHHCFAIVRDEDAAEDIAQETFITAYYKLNRYNPDYKLSTWLFKIATNKALTWLKKSKREILADDGLFASVASEQPSPGKMAEYSELHAAIAKLKSNYRAIVSLYYWKGLSYEEIATALAVPTGSVKVWMHRAKKQLKKELS